MIDKIISWVMLGVSCLGGVYVVLLVIWINWRRDEQRKRMKRIGAATNDD